MIVQTLRKSLRLVFILTVPYSVLWSKALPADLPQVTVSVHNDAGIPPVTLMQSEAEARRIFAQSGLEIRWLNCPVPVEDSSNSSLCASADFPVHLQLRIAKRSLNLNELTMGISFLSADGSGCYADLFYDRAEHLHETSRVNLASILGHAFAHEIGHLLLGTNSHSRTGLMRARWQPADLARASQGALLFSTQESQQMRSKLSAGIRGRRMHSNGPSQSWETNELSSSFRAER